MKPVSLRNLLLFWLTFLSLAALILFTTLMYSAPLLPWILLGLVASPGSSLAGGSIAPGDEGSPHRAWTGMAGWTGGSGSLHAAFS